MPVIENATEEFPTIACPYCSSEDIEKTGQTEYMYFGNKHVDIYIKCISCNVLYYEAYSRSYYSKL